MPSEARSRCIPLMWRHRRSRQGTATFSHRGNVAAAFRQLNVDIVNATFPSKGFGRPGGSKGEQGASNRGIAPRRCPVGTMEGRAGPYPDTDPHSPSGFFFAASVIMPTVLAMVGLARGRSRSVTRARR